MERLNVKALALALGVLGALWMLLLGWLAAFGWGVAVVDVISTLYIGFRPGFVGGIVGAAWGFVDCAIAGAVIAYVYNLIAARG